MSATRVLVADPLQIFRAGVRHLLSRESDFEVVEAASIADLFEAVETRQIEIALIDVDLPPLGGLAAVRRLARHDCVHSIVWGFDPASETVLEAIRAGADGFL